jgi:pilus assembly protein TadC
MIRLNLKVIKKLRLKERLAIFTPKRYKNELKKQMIYAGMKDEIIDKFIGFSFFFTIFLGFVIAFDLFLLGWGLNGILTGFGIGFGLLALIQISIVLIADSRAAEIENVLPDVLQLMAANVRAGMTVDRAIWLTARPEFGVFEEEIRRAGVKTVGGKTMKVALMEMSARVKSDLLEKTFRLVIEGIESGGELGQLLEETANNARTVQSLKKELKTSVTTYSIFIFFAAVLGAPMLYAISLFFVSVMTQLWSPSKLGSIKASGSSLGSSMGGGLLSKAGAPSISADQLFWFAIAAITLTTFFGSLIIGLIQTGREKSGVRYMPFLIFGALVMFFVAQYLIKIMFGGFFTI